MKRLLILVCLISFFLNCSDSDENPTNTPSPQIQFTKTLGGSLNDVANDVLKTKDGGYLVIGFTQSNDIDITDKPDESFDFWLLKFDQKDQLQWSKTFGGTHTEKAFKVTSTNDGGFAIVGYSDSSDGDVSDNSGLSDLWILKIDASGHKLWEKSHGFTGIDQGLSIIQTFDNGLLITGVLDVTSSNGEGNDKTFLKKHAGGDYWALKLNSEGNKIWRRYFGGTFTDTAYDVVETSDKGFLLVGSSDSKDVDVTNNKGEYDFWVVKINSQGTMQWEKSFGGSQIDEARSIIKTIDNNYLIIGDSRSTDQDISSSNGAADIWVVKITESGELIWEKSFGGSSFDVGRQLIQSEDGGFILIGSSRSEDGDVDMNRGQNDAWILKIDNNGKLLWEKTIGGSEIDFAYGVAELNDNSIILVGETNSDDGDMMENKGFTDVLISKIAIK